MTAGGAIDQNLRGRPTGLRERVEKIRPTRLSPPSVHSDCRASTFTTGVTVPQWSSILMLRNLKSPETYFQAAFRIQSPWSFKNPNGDNPNEEEVLKPVCFVFDFAPTRALRQLSEYAIGLGQNARNARI